MSDIKDIDMSKEELQEALTMMGVKFHHNAKLETLKELFVEAKGPKTSHVVEEGVDPNAHMILKRYKISCMNPAKRDWKGEIFTAGNDVVSRVKRFVPYNCPAAEAWHIPAILIDSILDRMYLETSLRKDHKGRDFIEKSWKPEFVLTELPPLTKEELARLAHMQRMQAAAGMGDD